MEGGDWNERSSFVPIAISIAPTAQLALQCDLGSHPPMLGVWLEPGARQNQFSSRSIAPARHIASVITLVFEAFGATINISTYTCNNSYRRIHLKSWVTQKRKIGRIVPLIVVAVLLVGVMTYLSNITKDKVSAAAAAADMTINKVAVKPGTLIPALSHYTPGTNLDFALDVTNNGPNATSDVVTVTDTVPTGLTPTGWEALTAGWNCNIVSQDVTCTFPSGIANGDSKVVLIHVKVEQGTTGQKINTANVQYSNDPDSNNNDSSITLSPDPRSDLSITKHHSGTPIAGGTYTYNFRVTNAGPSDVASYTITDTLDSNLTYVGVASGDLNCNYNAPTITCTGGPVVAATPNNYADTAITVQVDPGFPGGNISNMAHVAVPSDVTDPNPDNNDSNTDVTGVTDEADLSITKTPSSPTFNAGEQVTPLPLTMPVCRMLPTLLSLIICRLV